MELSQYSSAQLRTLEADLANQYALYQQAGLKLDLTRGKPSPDQLKLSDALDGILNNDYKAADGTDVRNYGGLDGLPEMKALAADMLDATPDDVLIGGNASLTLMHQYLSHAWFDGVRGEDTAWQRAAGRVKLICPVPGYDRHFTVCESLGIDMLTVPMTPTGPEMDQVEAMINDDPLIKGIWCVPKYSNPGGEVYSEATVKRLAALGKIAGPNFRIMWDNAYAVHDFHQTPETVLSLLTACREAGTEDTAIMFGSTSKITYAGAGVGFMAASQDNLLHFKKYLSAITIGPDKVNQLRHVRLLRNITGVREHMQQHAHILRPKFDRVLHHLEQELNGKGIGEWTHPLGGYFISFNSLPGLASEIVNLSADAGVKLTPAGATFPYGKDPDDSNIRLAPSFPGMDEIDQAIQVFTLCVKLASVRHLLKG